MSMFYFFLLYSSDEVLNIEDETLAKKHFRLKLFSSKFPENYLSNKNKFLFISVLGLFRKKIEPARLNSGTSWKELLWRPNVGESFYSLVSKVGCPGKIFRIKKMNFRKKSENF